MFAKKNHHRLISKVYILILIRKFLFNLLGSYNWIIYFGHFCQVTLAPDIYKSSILMLAKITAPIQAQIL